MSACTNHDYTVLLTIAGGLIVMALIVLAALLIWTDRLHP